MAEAARQRPLYPSEITPLKKSAPFDGRPFDGRIDRQTDSLPSVSPSKRPSPRALTATEARLCDWIEKYVSAEKDFEIRARLVQPVTYQGFIGARTFVAKYGPALILEAIHSLTYCTLDDYGKRRWWLERIVQPAQFLHFTLKELAQLQ